jgi:hypothetical protein
LTKGCIEQKKLETEKITVKLFALHSTYLLLAPQSGGGLVQQGAAAADGEWHIIVGGEGSSDINAALSLLSLAAQLGGLQMDDEGARAFAAQEHTTGSTAQAVIPVAAKAFLDVPRASLAAACSGHDQLLNRSDGFLYSIQHSILAIWSLRYQ